MMEALIIWEINQILEPSKAGIGKIKDNRLGIAFSLLIKPCITWFISLLFLNYRFEIERNLTKSP
jgi:hypothetical protein